MDKGGEREMFYNEMGGIFNNSSKQLFSFYNFLTVKYIKCYYKWKDGYEETCYSCYW